VRSAGVLSIATVQPVHVATWIEMSVRKLAAPLVQQRLAALRHLFDWLVNGQVVPINPAHTVRGPRHVVTCDKSRYLILRRRGRCSTASTRRPLPVYLRPLSRSMREPGPRNARLDVFRDKPPVPHNDWGCQPLRFTSAAYGENAFAIRLDFDRREDAEEFGKHFNERAIDRQLAYQSVARIVS
jgi:hypothetical protein